MNLIRLMLRMAAILSQRLQSSHNYNMKKMMKKRLLQVMSIMMNMAMMTMLTMMIMILIMMMMPMLMEKLMTIVEKNLRENKNLEMNTKELYIMDTLVRAKATNKNKEWMKTIEIIL